MRMIIMFDLPVQENSEKKEYLNFRKNLFRQGYTMIQYSIYSKCINTQTKVEQEVKRLKRNLPHEGNIRLLVVTEMQYNNMIFLVGTKNTNEEYNNEMRYIKI